ncbi:MAG: hypothetical protein ABIP79_07065 [Chitinophagaceae bacterium]
MKTASDSLWQLIRSLKSAEKTYLKRNYFFKKPDSKQLYLKLFDAIAKQKVYDETALITKFSPAITKKNIAFQKHYLQSLVGEAIAEYDSRNTIGHDLYNQILLIRVLRKRGLIDGANALWKKAVTKARASEMYPILTMLITEFEKMILSGSSETSYEDLHSVFKGRTITYNEYAEMITLRDIYTEVLLLKRKSHFDIEDDLKERIIFLLEVVNKTNIKKHVKSFWFRHYYRLSKATILYLLNDINNAMPLLKEARDDWEKNTQYITKDGEFYIELLYMINYAGILHGDYQFVVNSFNSPLNNIIDDPLQRANFEAIKYLALNKIYNKTAKYDYVNKLVQYMKTKYRHWEPLLNADLNRTLNFSLGIACFVLEQYNDALYFVKRGNTYFRDGTRQEHSAIAHILLLLITFSMDNDRLFEAEYRATYTYFYKRKKKHPFETVLVQCLKRSFYLTDKKAKIKEYDKALQVFEENKDDVVQLITFSIFNYPGWLISKVQNIPYRKYVELKVKAEKLQSILIN